MNYPQVLPLVPLAPKCYHCDTIAIGEYEITLVGISLQIPKDLDVFIDLTGLRRKRIIPPQYLKLLDKSMPDVIVWEVTDGKIDHQLPDFVLKLLEAGLKVGFGCHGAHGRTGWLAARLYKAIMGATGDQAVKWIREEFCEKAVESDLQTKDLGCVKEVGSNSHRGFVWNHLTNV